MLTWEQISKTTMGSMMTWGYMIYIFFPIPLFCLLLLSVPFRGIEKFGTNVVGKIFFTRVTVGPMYIRLVSVFIGTSLLIFFIASKSIQVGFASSHVPCTGTSCSFHSGETMWYRRASRYRAERNFWLSLFTLVLWLLVSRIYMLKEQVVRLRGDLETIRSDDGHGSGSGSVGGSGSGSGRPKNDRSKKEE